MYLDFEIAANIILIVAFVGLLALVPAFVTLAYGLFRDLYKKEANGMSLWLAVMNSGLACYFIWAIARSYKSVLIPIPTGFEPVQFLIWHIIRVVIIYVILFSLIKIEFVARRMRQENKRI